jgi:hypothetical protein
LSVCDVRLYERIITQEVKFQFILFEFHIWFLQFNIQPENVLKVGLNLKSTEESISLKSQAG